MTGKGEIFRHVASTMLTGRDVLNVKGNEWLMCLMQAAILASMSRPFDSLPALGGVHQQAPCRVSHTWALA